MKNKFYYTAFKCGFIILSLTGVVYGQNVSSDKTDMLSLRKLTALVEANPDNLKAHEDFIAHFEITDSALSRQYAAWKNKFPKSATTAYAIGKAYQRYHDPRAKGNLLRAAEINPNLADAWKYLSLDASLNGDNDAAINYIAKAVQLDKSSSGYAYRSAFLQRNGDPAKYDSLMMNVVYHFPKSEECAMALQDLGSLNFNRNEAPAYYEMLYNMYSQQQPAWFNLGMLDYYDYLINRSPEKAFDLALRMIAGVKLNRQDWKQRVIIARSFIEAEKSLEDNNAPKALAVLKQIDLNNGVMRTKVDADETLLLLEAKATDANAKTRDAFDSLSSYYSKKPSDNVRKALQNYAAKLNIDSGKIDSMIWKIRTSNAIAATDFNLENSVTHKKVSLADYKGKVVLLTYWFPSCFPCREEFPHFEAVLKNFSRTDVAYVAINAFGKEEAYVQAILDGKNNKYTFDPLHYPVNDLPKERFFPANFLIDQNGKVIFSDFQIDDKNEHQLELMISEVIQANAQTLPVTEKVNQHAVVTTSTAKAQPISASNSSSDKDTPPRK
jgi:thiol-disulfide isomerase/thioredoxin